MPDHLVQIHSRLPEISIGGEDILVWLSSSRKYFCA